MAIPGCDLVPFGSAATGGGFRLLLSFLTSNSASEPNWGLDGPGWAWMGLDGPGWAWMGLDGPGVSWCFFLVNIGKFVEKGAVS